MKRAAEAQARAAQALRGPVVLLTDFGDGCFQGVMKGVILSRAPDCRDRRPRPPRARRARSSRAPTCSRARSRYFPARERVLLRRRSGRRHARAGGSSSSVAGGPSRSDPTTGCSRRSCAAAGASRPGNHEPGVVRERRHEDVRGALAVRAGRGGARRRRGSRAPRARSVRDPGDPRARALPPHARRGRGRGRLRGQLREPRDVGARVGPRRARGGGPRARVRSGRGGRSRFAKDLRRRRRRETASRTSAAPGTSRSAVRGGSAILELGVDVGATVLVKRAAKRGRS